MPALFVRNWPAKLIVFLVIAFALQGFVARIVDPLAAAVDLSVGRGRMTAVELILLAAYTLGLFAFPGQFWRRAFKFVCLMAAYMLLGPVLAALLIAGLGGTETLFAVSLVSGHALALVLGFLAYKAAWPHLQSRAPRFNPAA